jgi:Mg2+ and Co2+ transporter CorA
VNFSYMPETQWRYDFYAILALCTSLAVEMLV